MNDALSVSLCRRLVQPLFGAIVLLLFIPWTTAEDGGGDGGGGGGGEGIHACAQTQTHACTSLSQKEQALSLSSLTAWLLILLPKYHKTGYNIYNYPHLH